MNFEVLKRSHIKRNIIIAVIIILMLSAIILTFTKAKYKTTASIPLVNGTINYDLSDLNLIGVYIQEGEEYKQTNEIPTSGYEFNSEESYCTINNERDDTITLSFDMTTQNLIVTPLTKKGTKCYLYFDEQSSGSEYILASENAPTNSTTDWTNNGTGITYYYAGDTNEVNNWVSFAGFYWRIIRINGDGTIRMIYQGVADSETPDEGNIRGEETQIGTKAFNSSYNNNMYVGFKYGSDSDDYATTHANINNSTILGADDRDDTSTLNGWYRANLLGYANYIDGNAGFCGDRRVTSGTGTGTSTTYYQPYTRISDSSPSLSCNTNDIYTTTDSSTGNKALTYPIGLISADEAMLAGIPNWNSSGNTNNYLYTEQTYWTMSPFSYSSGGARVFVVWSDGDISDLLVSWADYGVRPVINIRSNVELTGTGSQTDPFVVVKAS